MPSPADSLTPGRDTSWVFDTPEWGVMRPPWQIVRHGLRLLPAKEAKTLRLPTGEHVLKPVQLDTPGDWPTVKTAIITKAKAQTVSDLEEFDAWVDYARPQTAAAVGQMATAMGATASADWYAKITGAPHLLTRARPAGASWATELTADVSALPKIASARVQPVPLDRVLAGSEDHPENAGYTFRFRVPGHALTQADHIATFYFGGPATTLPAEKKGGQFGLAIYGDGYGKVYERLVAGWQELADFQWAAHGAVFPGQSYSLAVVPYGADRLYVRSHVLPANPGISGPKAFSLTAANPPGVLVGPSITASRVDYTSKASMTGRGRPRVEVRRDLDVSFSASRLVYPTSAVYEGKPFLVPPYLPEAQALYLALDAHTPADTTVTVALLDADTGAEIAAGTETTPGVSTFPLPRPTRACKVRVTLTGPGDKTPLLRGYRAWINGRIELVNTTPVAAAVSGNVSVTGPSADPAGESAKAEALDLSAALTVLRRRARVPARLVVRAPLGGEYRNVILFDGEVAKAPRTPFGSTGGAWPPWNAARLQVSAVGRWSRLADQMPLSLFEFTRANRQIEPSVQPDPRTGRYPSWKVTDVIRYAFTLCGVPDSQLSIPDLPVRLLPSGTGDSEELLLVPGTRYVDFIAHLAKDRLGYFVHWDPNAPPAGLWRVRKPPRPPYTYVAAFHLDSDSVLPAGALAHAGAAWGETAAFVRRGTYTPYVIPPEANWVQVTASGQIGDGLEPAMATAPLINPASYHYDPETDAPTADHPDFLGHHVPLLYYDPSLSVPGDPQSTAWNLSYQAKRIYNRSAHAELWADYQARLLFVVDPELGHYRPLCYYDPVLVGGQPALIHSCNAEYESDLAQWAHYEIMYQTNVLLP